MPDSTTSPADHALQRTQRRLIAAATATALAATAAFTGAPSLAAGGPANAATPTPAPTSPPVVSDDGPASRHGLIVHWKAKPHGGDGANVASELWNASGKYPVWHDRTRNLDEAKRSSESWATPFVDGNVTGALTIPLAQRAQTAKVVCHAPTSAQLAEQADYAKTLESLWRGIDALRTDAARRATLPAGPTVNGHATVEALVIPVGPGKMAPDANYVDYDAQTGAILRTRGAQNFGFGWSPGPAYQDYTLWELRPATKSALAKLQPPAAITKRCK